MTAAQTSAIARSQAGPPMSASDIYANARALSTYLGDKSDEIDEARRLPPEVAARLRDAGMFRLMMPRDWGGPELCPLEQVEIIEELAKGNASAAWCVMIGCDSGYFAGYLNERTARELYPRLDMATAGMLFPVGRADRVAGGYKISGQWAFASGITHADVVLSGCFIYEDGVLKSESPERVPWRAMLAPASEFQILDTWHTIGLRGTGSNDYRVADLFVPEERSFSLLDPPRRTTTLWRWRNNFLPKVTGVPLGAARAMIDRVTAMMGAKVEMPTMKLYKNLPRIQAAIGDAEMILGAARSYVFSANERMWKRLEREERPTDKERADVWLASVNAARSGREVVRLLFDAVGGSAIYSKKNPFDRWLRDAETWCQHVVVQRRMLEAVGGMLLNADERPWSPLL